MTARNDRVWYVIDLGAKRLLATFAGKGDKPPARAVRLAEEHTNTTGETTAVALGVAVVELP